MGHRLLNDRPLEKIRIVARVQARGVTKRKLPEVLLGHEALFDQLERFRNHLPEIGHVEMREVGAEHRSKAHAHARIEGPQRRAIVRLAAEVKVVREYRADILL